MAKGALTKDPKQKQASPPNPQRIETRINYLKKVRPNDPEIRRLSRQLKQLQPAPAPGPAGAPELSPAQMGEDLYQRFAGQAQQFDPRTFQQQYEGQFGSEMDRYRQNIMGQFERRNAEEFARQTQELEQSLAERGLDPSSPAAQSLREQLTKRQDLARQEALSAAEQGAYGVQQQAFGQAQATAMMPGQIWGQFADPYMAQQRFGFETELQKMQNRQRRWEIKNQPRGGGGGGGGGGGMDPWQMYWASQLNQNFQPQQPQPDPIAQGAQGLLQGIGLGVGQMMGKGG